MKSFAPHALTALILSTGITDPARARVILDTGPLSISYEESDLLNLGTPAVGGAEIVFTPGLHLEAPADQQSYYDWLSFSASLRIEANRGYRVTGLSLTASGSSYVGDDATLGVADAFSLVFYGASYYGGALSGEGPWSTTGTVAGMLPDIGFTGSLWVSTENHYSYETIVGYEQEARYDYVYFEDLVGYEPIFDEEGNPIGEQPIYEGRYEEVFLGYFDIPIYGTVYQTSGGSISLERVVLSVQVEAAPVPLPPTLLLLGSGAGLLYGGRVRRPRR